MEDVDGGSLGGEWMFRWNKPVLIRAAITLGAFAAFVIGSGAGWYWD